MPPLVERTSFKPDEETTGTAKNTRLATLLNGPWNDFEIVRIERIEIGGSGWRVTYRE
jgi:hypothetical protein